MTRHRIVRIQVETEDGKQIQWTGQGQITEKRTQTPVAGVTQPNWPFEVWVSASLVVVQEPTAEEPNEHRD